MAYPEHKKETGHKKEKVEEEETVYIESEEETAKAAQKTKKPKVVSPSNYMVKIKI